jgi:hypothetical protein
LNSDGGIATDVTATAIANNFDLVSISFDLLEEFINIVRYFHWMTIKPIKKRCRILKRFS